MPIKILYEDNHLLALDKPPGLLTQPSERTENSLETEAKAFIKERDHKPSNVFLHPVHRLDSLASGIVLFAKTQKALSRLSASMREKGFHKTYVAVVEGRREPEEGLYVDFLIHGDHMAVVADASHHEAKRSELAVVSVQAVGSSRWRLEIDLLTGRYHQIRSQLACRGFFILGDGKYGSTAAYAPNAIALHHARLSFPHPTLRSSVVIESADPFLSLRGF